MWSMTERDRRWPARVYGSGDEPDPRFSLANERTFLAYIRTALALLAAAAAVDALDLPMSDLAQRVAATALALSGLVCAIQAWRGWVGTERALRHHEPLPGSPTTAPLAVGVAIVAIVLVAAMVLR
jgi:putative membrane protein